MALDVGIAKIGIFCFVFLIAFGGILALIPTGFSPEGLKDYADLSNKIPDEWNGVSLLGYNFTETWNTTLQHSVVEEYPSIGNRDMLLMYAHGVLDTGSIILSHRYGLGLLFHEDMIWFDDTNEQKSEWGITGRMTIYSYTIDEEYTDGNSVYTVVCNGKGGAWFLGSSSYFFVTVIFSFNQTLYDTPNEAWSNSDLDMLIGINPENVNLSKDIWFMVTSILAFNTAEIFGTNTPNTWQYILNYIISGVVWAGILIFAGVIALEVWTAIFP